MVTKMTSTELSTGSVDSLRVVTNQHYHLEAKIRAGTVFAALMIKVFQMGSDVHPISGCIGGNLAPAGKFASGRVEAALNLRFLSSIRGCIASVRLHRSVHLCNLRGRPKARIILRTGPIDSDPVVIFYLLAGAMA